VEATDLIGNLLSFINSTLAVFSKVSLLTEKLSSSYGIVDLEQKDSVLFKGERVFLTFSVPVNEHRNQCCGSGMFIPDPTFFHPVSKFCPSRIRIKEFKYFNPQKNGF
jgi:hypothetical protein